MSNIIKYTIYLKNIQKPIVLTDEIDYSVEELLKQLTDIMASGDSYVKVITKNDILMLNPRDVSSILVSDVSELLKERTTKIIETPKIEIQNPVVPEIKQVINQPTVKVLKGEIKDTKPVTTNQEIKKPIQPIKLNALHDQEFDSIEDIEKQIRKMEQES